MAFTGNYMCSTYKLELLTAVHDHTNSTGDSFKMSLYTNTATLDETTAAYTATGEVAAGSGYTTTGQALTNTTPSNTTTTAFTNFSDETWTTASFTARGALIYNDTAAGDPAVVVLDFGSDKTGGGGDFTVQFPAFDSTNAIIRITA
jgi:hypothetical protein